MFNTHIPDEVMERLVEDDTAFGPQIGAQAWALGDPSVPIAPYRERPSWRTVARRMGIVLSGMVAIAGLVLLLVNHSAPSAAQDDPPPAAISASRLPDIPTEPPVTPPFWVPTVTAQQETQDSDFLTRLRIDDISVDDPVGAIRYAHDVCRYHALGYTAYDYAMWSYRIYGDDDRHPFWVFEDEAKIAITVYCR
jgi:hypothetical protein